MADLERSMHTFMSRMELSQQVDCPSTFPNHSSPIIDSDEIQARSQPIH